MKTLSGYNQETGLCIACKEEHTTDSSIGQRQEEKQAEQEIAKLKVKGGDAK